MNFIDYEEIYHKIEDYLEKNMTTFKPYLLSIVLINASKSNLGRGIFSRKFFSVLPEKLHKQKFFDCKNLTSISEYLFSLTTARALTLKQFESMFD